LLAPLDEHADTTIATAPASTANLGAKVIAPLLLGRERPLLLGR
jgi:hypothetical protein